MSTINKSIKTILSWEDIALIAVTFGNYQSLYKDRLDEEFIKRGTSLVNRLGAEMSAYPKKDFTKK